MSGHPASSPWVRPLAVAVPALLILAVGLFAYGAIHRTVRSVQQMEEGYRVVVALEQLLLRLVDAETSERGYLVTGDERFLAPYRGVREDVSRYLDTLQRLSPTETQRERVERLGPLVTAKLDRMEHNVTLRRAGDVAGAEASVRSGEGKELMDAVRVAIADVEQAQSLHLAVQGAEVGTSARQLGLIVLLGSLFGLSVAALANLVLARHARAQGALAAEVEQQNRRLQQQKAELEMANEQLQLAYEAVQREQGVSEEMAGRLDALFRHAPVGLGFFDTSLRFVRVNDRLAQINGRPADEHVGRHVLQVLPNQNPRVLDGFQRVLETGEPWITDVTGETPALPGETRTWSVGYYPVSTPNGTLIGLGAVVDDVTEERRAEQREREGRARAEESERQFRTLANSIPQLAWMADETGSSFWYNERWYHYTDTSLQQMQGRGWRTVHHPDHLDRVVSRVDRAVQNGEAWEDTFPLRRRDGEYRWFLSRAMPIRDEEGRVVRWFGTSTDVHDQKLLEAERERLYRSEAAARAALAERTEIAERREAELAAVLEHLPAAVWIADRDGRILRVNPGTAALYGDAPMSETAERYVEYEAYWPAGHRKAGQRLRGRDWALARSLATGETVLNEPLEIVRFDTGERRQVLNNTAAVRDAEGRITGCVAVMFDITEQENTRRALVAAHAEAEEANRAKMDFLSAMSHELRTPLNAIAGYVDLMEVGIYGENSPGQLQALERVRRNQRSLLTLINDILQYARIEAGRLEFDFQDVVVADLLCEIEAMIEPQVRGAELEYCVEQCDPSLTVVADGERVRQILLNLLTNAVKFTAPGGRVSISCETTRRRVAIHVRDSGRGIPAELVQKIFDPFFQAERKKNESSQQGVGLGLAISRDLAVAMGGDLTVETTLGHGSTFTLRLPGRDWDGGDEGRRSGWERHSGGDRRAEAGAE
jgi:PAS domain S-box-containing protein